MGQGMRDRLKLNPEDFLSREPQGWQLTANRISEIDVEFDGNITCKLTIDPLRKQFEGSTEPAAIVLAYGSRRYFDSLRSKASERDSLKSLFDPLATVAHPSAWLSRLDLHAFRSVGRALREVFVLRDDDEILRDEEGRILVRAHGRDTPIERLSEGYKTLFAMVIDIARQMQKVWGSLEHARGIVLIDEIETHLHPKWKMKIMGALRAAFPKVQFISTTHDPLCLRGMTEGEVKVLYRNEVELVDILDDLPNVQLLRNDQLLTSDYFGLPTTSDEEVETSLDEYAALAGKPNLDRIEISRLSHLEEKLSNIQIGDNLLEQVKFEAIGRYINERGDARKEARLQLREDAVQEVLDLLRSRTPLEE
jgi:hypothetical protein